MSFAGGAVDLGTAYGRIVLDASGVDAAIGRAQDALNRLSGVGAGIRGLGANLTALMAPIMALGVQGVRAVGSFDDAMREIEARAGLTGDELEAVRQTAIQMGEATVFGATDAANAMLQLLSSGLDVNEALAVLPAVMDGAAASGESLAYTADAVTDIMAQFGLEADDARYVVDALVRAAGSGSATFGNLADGFQNCGGLAAQFGLSVEEAAAVLQIFSENGIKGSEAGTQFRSMLNHMYSTTDEVTGAWERMNIALYEADGTIRPLNDVMADLRVAMADMTDEERIELVHTLAGAYGQLGLMALTTGDDIDDMRGSMEGAADAASVAETRMQGWSGATENLSGSIETLQLEVLGPFVDNVLIPLVLHMADVVNMITAWARENPELASTAMVVLAILATMGPVLLIVGQLIMSVTAVVGALAAMFGFLLSPLILAIIGLGILGVAFATNFRDIRIIVADAVARVIERMGDLWQAIQSAEGVGGAAAVVRQNVEDAFTGLDIDFGAIGETISDRFWGVVGPALSVAATVGESVASAFTGLDIDFGAIGETISNDFWNALGAALSVVGIVAGGPVGAIAGIAHLVVAAFENDFLGIGTLLQESGIIPTVETALGDLWNSITSAISNIFGGGEGEGGEGSDLLSGLVGGLEEIGTHIQGVVETIGGYFATLWENASPELENLINYLGDEFFPTLGEFFEGPIKGAIELFTNLLGGIWETVGPALGDLANWFAVEGLPGAIKFLTDNVLPIIENFIGILTGVWELVSPALTDLVRWFTKTGLPAAERFVREHITPVIETFIGILSNIWDMVSEGLEYFRVHFEGIVGDVIGFFQPLVDMVEGLINGLRNLGMLGGPEPGGSGITTPGWGGVGEATGHQGGPVDPMVGMAAAYGYQQGGYTGDGPPDEIAGVTHRGEYVVPRGGALVMQGAGAGGATYNFGDIVLPDTFFTPGMSPQEQAGSFLEALQEEINSRG